MDIFYALSLSAIRLTFETAHGILEGNNARWRGRKNATSPTGNPVHFETVCRFVCSEQCALVYSKRAAQHVSSIVCRSAQAQYVIYAKSPAEQQHNNGD